MSSAVLIPCRRAGTAGRAAASSGAQPGAAGTRHRQPGNHGSGQTARRGHQPGAVPPGWLRFRQRRSQRAAGWPWKRAAALTGQSFTGKAVVVIGDTPADIACGQAIGAATVAVATGPYPMDALAALAPIGCSKTCGIRRPCCLCCSMTARNRMARHAADCLARHRALLC
ncbi:MAG: HAD hydrolase-like protein [Anaerolineae bacterium]|uniref:HAD hydrolase-like protein n=1 Tax=Candidatus Amarolinea dominans TaxID=3140696 RepID=UPI0031371EAE|nr:HAD hydrolase-like protein [Anaerolineae bacterium]